MWPPSRAPIRTPRIVDDHSRCSEAASVPRARLRVPAPRRGPALTPANHGPGNFCRAGRQPRAAFECSDLAVKPVLDLVTKLGPARLAAMAAVTLTLIGFFAFVILRVSQPDMGVLFTDLSMQDSAAVIRDLDARGIRYETKGDAGQTILAPRADLAAAAHGPRRQGPAGAGRRRLRDLRQGRRLLVHQLRPEREPPARARGRARPLDPRRSAGSRRRASTSSCPSGACSSATARRPSAAIVLKLMGDLDAGQVRAIRHLAASAVEGLKPDRVSIVDERGRLLADGARGRRGRAPAAASRSSRSALERRLRGADRGDRRRHRRRRAAPASRSAPSSTSTGSRAGPRPSIPRAGSCAPTQTRTENSH